ncbi:hypothetical protein T484DRAFT_3443624 [Baffinella frigidus]|nr:hypothetical protein T484DRAFT_3443624 [Cryptophyta sp. CCMP2293]
MKIINLTTFARSVCHLPSGEDGDVPPRRRRPERVRQPVQGWQVQLEPAEQDPHRWSPRETRYGDGRAPTQHVAVCTTRVAKGPARARPEALRASPRQHPHGAGTQGGERTRALGVGARRGSSAPRKALHAAQ